MEERLRELALNFKIWTDIQRTRQYPVPSESNPGEVNFVDVVGASNNWGQTYEEHHLLYPIPDDEIQTNPALEQNPGYN
ncbi:MAG: RagB/SusD family nutrient uptake outer membrane protein [Balneolaceae bacterium]|nr:RagB/SusD family nutrient uptake outer membrane protein [Balneolaceae bacterium]